MSREPNSQVVKSLMQWLRSYSKVFLHLLNHNSLAISSKLKEYSLVSSQMPGSHCSREPKRRFDCAWLPLSLLWSWEATKDPPFIEQVFFGRQRALERNQTWSQLLRCSNPRSQWSQATGIKRRPASLPGHWCLLLYLSTSPQPGNPYTLSIISPHHIPLLAFWLPRLLHCSVLAKLALSVLPKQVCPTLPCVQNLLPVHGSLDITLIKWSDNMVWVTDSPFKFIHSTNKYVPRI